MWFGEGLEGHSFVAEARTKRSIFPITAKGKRTMGRVLVRNINKNPEMLDSGWNEVKLQSAML